MANDKFDQDFNREVIKNNLHRVMLDNIDTVGKLLSIRTDVFVQVCFDHGVMNKTQIEDLLQRLIRAKIIQVVPLPK